MTCTCGRADKRFQRIPRWRKSMSLAYAWRKFQHCLSVVISWHASVLLTLRMPIRGVQRKKEEGKRRVLGGSEKEWGGAVGRFENKGDDWSLHDSFIGIFTSTAQSFSAYSTFISWVNWYTIYSKPCNFHKFHLSSFQRLFHLNKQFTQNICNMCSTKINLKKLLKWKIAVKLCLRIQLEYRIWLSSDKPIYYAVQKLVSAGRNDWRTASSRIASLYLIRTYCSLLKHFREIRDDEGNRSPLY